MNQKVLKRQNLLFSGQGRPRLLFDYHGPFTMERIVEIGESLIDVMKPWDFDGLLHRIFCVMVEMTQNMKQYSLDRGDFPGSTGGGSPGNPGSPGGGSPGNPGSPGGGSPGNPGSGSFLVYSLKGFIVLESENPIRETDAESLRLRIDQINQAVRSGQLKELFLARRAEGGGRNTDGAGIGLIDMARKSGEPLRVKVFADKSGQLMFRLGVCLGC